MGTLLETFLTSVHFGHVFLTQCPFLEMISFVFIFGIVFNCEFFQVVVTVGELARLYESQFQTRPASNCVGLRIDKSALEPIVRYHDYLWLIGQENDHCLSAYSSPRIRRTASTRDSASARRKATAISSQISTKSERGERDNDEDEFELADQR